MATPNVMATDQGGGQIGPAVQPKQQTAPNPYVQSQNINPTDSLRQKVLTPINVTDQIKPGTVSFNPLGAPDQITADKVDVSGFGIDQGSFAMPEAKSASAGRRLNFRINPQSVLQKAMDAFKAQLPDLNIDFADQSEQLAKKTSAMGRTGSGLFNRDTGFISDRARAKREALLGNLAFQGATSDQSADLRAQIARQNLLGSQEDRFARTSVANMQSANQLAAQGAQNSLQAALANQRMNADAAALNSQQALQAALANQSANMQTNQLNALQDFAGQQFNVSNDLNAQMANVANAINQGQWGANFMADQQARQDMIAAQAQQDLAQQLNFLQQGFAGDPTQAMMAGAGGIADLANQWGATAGQGMAAAGQGASAGINAMSQLFGGGAPAAQPSQPMDFNFQPQTIGIDPSVFGSGPATIGLQPDNPQGFSTFGTFDGFDVDQALANWKPSMHGYDSTGMPYKGVI